MSNYICPKCCVLTILYNPDNKCIKNIMSYSRFFKKCFVIDNSANNNSYLFESINNVVYFPNNKNLGIAAALNIGCSVALDEGFEWCMTMDQDSSWTPDYLEMYLTSFLDMKNHYSNIKSFAPTPLIERSYLGKLKIIIKNFIRRNKDIPVYSYCDKVICSGNIINLESWKTINGFEEKLFIDEVDFDFCFRLRENGYEIVKYNTIFFSHVLGAEKKQILFSKDTHSSSRLFYIFRNRFYIIKKHPDFAHKYSYRKGIIKLFIHKCIFDISFLSNLKAYSKAKRDYSLYD